MGAHIRMDKEEMHKLAEPAPVAHAAIHNVTRWGASSEVAAARLEPMLNTSREYRSHVPKSWPPRRVENGRT